MGRPTPRHAIYIITEMVGLEADGITPICTGRVKIGITTNWKKRVASLQTGNSNILLLVGWHPCASREHALRAEANVHSALAEHAIRGEWFATDAEYAAAVIDSHLGSVGLLQ